MSVSTRPGTLADDIAYLEQIVPHIDALVAGMSPSTAQMVRTVIQQAVNNGHALDEAWRDYGAAADRVREIPVPEPGRWKPEHQRYYDAVATESRYAGLVDDLRGRLGVRV